MKQLIEAVPNFSEGRREEVIKEIVAGIESVQGVIIKYVDIGYDTNRTVVTFIGEPKAVLEAAFLGVSIAQRLIDMRFHSGCHPRIGATDVLPLVPLENISLEDCAKLARVLAKRIFEKLGIPCYCYEAAAFVESNKNLAYCRKGEYESLPKKMESYLLRPDFSPGSYNEIVAKSGATNVGARNFLIAVNFNLNTKSKDVANEIACKVRESGKRIIKNGKVIHQKGSLKACKAIGWYIEKYGFAQVSMNITDINIAPLHLVYEEVKNEARKIGFRVTGTEIIGLIPKVVLLEAGKYFYEKQKNRMDFLDDESYISLAIKEMNFNQLEKFSYEKILGL